MKEIKLPAYAEGIFDTPIKGPATVTVKVPLVETKILANNRGKILGTAILVENNLEKILEILLLSNSYDSTDFGKQMWRKRRIDFNVKFQMLRALSSTHKLIKKDADDWKKLRHAISDVINIRNRFAHGKLYFFFTQRRLKSYSRTPI